MKFFSEILCHWKLIEALGIIITLSAFAFEWQSVKKWQTAEDEINFFFSSFDESWYNIIDQHENNYREAVNHSTRDIKINPNNADGLHESAWQYKEVRYFWFRQIVYEANMGRQFVTTVKNLTNKHKLELPENLDKYLEISDQLLKHFGVHEKIPYGKELVALTPDAPSLPSSMVYALQQKRDILRSEKTLLINKLSEQVREKSRKSTRNYIMLFLFGGFLLAAAKTIDWWLTS